MVCPWDSRILQRTKVLWCYNCDSTRLKCFPQVCSWIRLLPHVFCMERNPGPCWAPGLPLPSGCGRGGGHAHEPRVLASPHEATSPTIPPGCHLSIHVHKPGTEPPGGRECASDAWLSCCPSWRASGGCCSRWSWEVWLKPQMESPEGETGLLLLKAGAWRPGKGRYQETNHLAWGKPEGLSEIMWYMPWMVQMGKLRAKRVGFPTRHKGNVELS